MRSRVDGTQGGRLIRADSELRLYDGAVVAGGATATVVAAERGGIGAVRAARDSADNPEQDPSSVSPKSPRTRRTMFEFVHRPFGHI